MLQTEGLWWWCPIGEIVSLQEKPTGGQVHGPLWRTFGGNLDKPKETQQVLVLLCQSCMQAIGAVGDDNRNLRIVPVRRI